MFSYTTSAAYSAGTSYGKTESGSGNANSKANTSEKYGPFLAEPLWGGYANGNGSNSGSNEVFIAANGGRSNKNEGEDGQTWESFYFAGNGEQGNTNTASATESPDGGYTQQYGATHSYSYNVTEQDYTESENWVYSGGVTRNSSGETYESGRTRTRDNKYDGSEVFPASGSGTQTFNTTATRAIQTSTTTTYEYYPAATTQTTFYNKKGTTTTAGTITFPTTTETSWTEIAITNTTKTKTSTVVTTKSEASHRSAITAHTVIHVADGETLYTLIQSPNIETPFTGTENWQSIQGPDTITISRWPCATYQCAVLDASAEPFDSNAPETSSTKTRTEMNGVETTNLTSFYKTTEGLPLGSTSFEGAGSIIKTTSETYVAVSSPSPTAATSQRVAVTQTATHNVNIGGVAFPVNGKAETANVTVVVPFVRSAKDNSPFSDTGEYGDGTYSVEGNNAGGFTEAGNFFVAYGVHNFPNNGGISDAYLRRTYAWATVGDGTSATAVPKKSWTINNVSKVTWEAVSVSDGVATPWPVFGVETTSTTTSTAENQTASTASTATATTAIWGNLYRRTTSSSNSSGVTSSVNTTELEAGGNGHTMLELGGLPALPTPAYIPSPVGSVLPVFGAAHVDGKRTVIIMPAEYANTTVTAPKTYSGSTLPETYFETKSLQVVLEGQGGAVQRLESLW